MGTEPVVKHHLMTCGQQWAAEWTVAPRDYNGQNDADCLPMLWLLPRDVASLMCGNAGERTYCTATIQKDGTYGQGQ